MAPQSSYRFRPVPQIQPIYTDPLQPDPKGLVKSGNSANIDATELPVVYNPDGGWGTIKSSSFDMGDGKETLIPTIVNGQPAPFDDEEANKAAMAEYGRTGRNLGVFDTPENADAYAQTFHENWEAGRIPGLAMPDQEKLHRTLDPDDPNSVRGYYRDNGYLNTVAPQSSPPAPYRVKSSQSGGGR